MTHSPPLHDITLPPVIKKGSQNDIGVSGPGTIFFAVYATFLWFRLHLG